MDIGRERERELSLKGNSPLERKKERGGERERYLWYGYGLGQRKIQLCNARSRRKIQLWSIAQEELLHAREVWQHVWIVTDALVWQR